MEKMCDGCPMWDNEKNMCAIDDPNTSTDDLLEILLSALGEDAPENNNGSNGAAESVVVI